MIKKYIEKLFFSFMVVVFSLTGLFIYIKIISRENKKDEGFANASPTYSNKFVCKANNFECIKNLMIDLNKSNENALLFGNSQLGAINQFSKGEINYAHQLSLKSLQNREQQLTIRSIWIPNATLGEFKKIYFSIKKCSTRIDNLIIPLFLDDMREQKNRESLENYSLNICGSIPKLSDNKNEKDVNLDIVSNSNKLDSNILNNTLILRDIKSINSHFRVFVYKLRNSILGITASTKRKIIPTAYQYNLEALKSIIESRNSQKMVTIIYIPPLLNFSSGKEIPYFKNDYLNFKDEMKDICNKQNCIFFDLDSIIPDEKWGYKESTSLKGNKKEIDFMHFTYSGHQIMSKKLFEILNNHIYK